MQYVASMYKFCLGECFSTDSQTKKEHNMMCTGLLTIMTVLLLWTSSFVAVDAFCPQLCDCSTKDLIACMDKSITNISALSIPSNFTYIRISGTQASELTDTTFQRMPVTVRLFLDGNNFSIITSGAFQKFPFLKSLKLSNNGVRSLPPKIFNSLLYLEQLFLEQNGLSQLDPLIFKDLGNLAQLTLNRNMLTELPVGLLDHLVNLNLINLSRNKLSTLPKYIFRSLLKLKSLFLYNNRLKEITPGIFETLTELEELSLYSNLIEIIDKEAFYNLPKLQKLALHKNCLKTLPDGLFLYLPLLNKLTLYENPLTELPTVLFGSMDYLSNLWLYHTNLTSVPNFVFSNLTNLNLLVLTRNAQLHSLPTESFSGLSKLRELSLHTNNFSSLTEGLFQDLPQLKDLSLYNNNFEYLPEALLHPLRNLQNLYLNSSRLTTLPGNFFKTLTKLNEVYLDGNPWACDCKLKELKMWLEDNVAMIQNYKSLICESPFELKGKPVFEFDVPVCPYPTTQSKSHFYEATSSALATHSTQSGEVIRHTTDFSDSVASLPNQVQTTHTLKSLKVSLSTLADTTTVGYLDDSTRTSLPSYVRTTPKTTAEHDLHTGLFGKWGLRLQYGKIIIYLYTIAAVIQIVLIFITCFSLLTMRKLYSYFKSIKEPVVLLRILIPISPASPY